MARYLFIALTFLFVFPSCQSSETKKQSKIQKLNEEIELLQREAQKFRKRSFEELMDAQKEMLNDWEDFARDIKEAEDLEDRAQLIEKQIRELQEEQEKLSVE